MRVHGNRGLAWSICIAIATLTGGCQTTADELSRPDSFPPEIPRTSMLISAGEGRQTFKVVDPGRAYVYDADAARVVFQTHVEPNQRLTVDPAEDRIALDGRVVFEKNLAKRHTHRIYYDSRDTAATSQPNRFDVK
jgi:hypothetical protein